ncbi:MAG TPA: hypothetical protein VF183_07405 [Acidimicrobiales bacterium]
MTETEFLKRYATGWTWDALETVAGKLTIIGTDGAGDDALVTHAVVEDVGLTEARVYGERLNFLDEDAGWEYGNGSYRPTWFWAVPVNPGPLQMKHYLQVHYLPGAFVTAYPVSSPLIKRRHLVGARRQREARVDRVLSLRDVAAQVRTQPREPIGQRAHEPRKVAAGRPR